MPDLASLQKSLQGIAGAFQTGGLYFLIGVCAFLAYKVAMRLTKRQRKASQEVTVNLSEPSPGNLGNGSGKTCPLHSGVMARVETLDRAAEILRQENREQHEKIFDGLSDVSVRIAGLVSVMKK